MSRTVTTRSLPVVALDGRADARGSVVVSHDVARAALAALAGLTVHPWPGVEHGEGRPSLSLSAALVGVPDAPEGIMQAHAAMDAAAGSTPVTRCPRAANPIVSRPVPQPRSSTRDAEVSSTSAAKASSSSLHRHSASYTSTRRGCRNSPWCISGRPSVGGAYGRSRLAWFEHGTVAEFGRPRFPRQGRLHLVRPRLPRCRTPEVRGRENSS